MQTLAHHLFNQKGRRRGIHRSVTLIVALALVLLFAGQGQLVYAAGLSVTTTDDELNSDGDCSLREAIQAANTDTPVDACQAGSGADTIIVPAGIYILSIAGVDEDANETGDLDISSDVTIQGEGTAATIFDAGTLDRVLHIIAGQVQISSVTIRNGTSADLGGGIRNDGTLIITNSKIADNSAENGAGIFNQGSLNITGSTFTGNTTTCCGGAITNSEPGVAIIENSTFSGNSSVAGGGLNNFGGDLTLTYVTLMNNMAVNGGGVFNMNSGTVSITHSTISENTATDGGGGIFNHEEGSSIVVDTSTITGNTSWFRGGGMVNDGTLQINESIISGNEALDTNSNGWPGEGGAVSNYGRLTITNSTVSSNSAFGVGGGIVNRGTVQIEGSTLSANHALDNIGGPGDGGAVRNLAMFSITNSTVSSNSASGGGGGIRNHSFGDDTATLTIMDSMIEDNSAEGGGGIDNEGDLSVFGSSFTGNTATCCGGAIANGAGGVAKIDKSTFSENNESGIANDGDLTLTDVTLQNNTANYGGGLFNSGTASIIHGMITDNTATQGGGGIHNREGGVVSIEMSRITGNSAWSGGGVDNSVGPTPGTVTITASQVLGNKAHFGGGIYNEVGTVTLDSSGINNNTATLGGGIFNIDLLFVNNSVITGNTASDPGSGGGIFNADEAGGVVSLTKSKVRGNQPDDCVGC